MKSNFVIDLELLINLSISKSETIVLDMLHYINNNPHYPAFKVTNKSLSDLLQISRGHLQRLLKSLMQKELIYKDSNRYIISEYYREIKKNL
ncbi:hypothetical protein CQA53_08840 [Helicobacter didelphidarum]|uniref:Helix-turn-helix domain-containing protein n=1 Tax=Helicobacter didelphidarum TaxID=2040648 RepID=A0A3D8ID97_9HELI|nr:hypothetical protein [Helicobacter didelphidarum]RDU62916.1 hypothetical protein CQA53_08840 [Helicobacter didelphidarum]